MSVRVQETVIKATNHHQQTTIHPLVFTTNGFSVLDDSTDIDTLITEVPSFTALGADPIPGNE